MKGIYPKILSNLFQYTFKYKNNKLQNKVFTYSGKETLALGKLSNYDWKETQEIYFQGKPIKRNSKDYDDIIDELYISAIQNPFYRNAIKKCPLPIVHVIGETDKTKKVLTRYEFEFMLNCLHDYLNKKD